MEGFVARLNVYLIPPVLFLLTGFSLAIFSLVKEKHQRDTVTFALLCLWWSLLSIAFIAHHLFKGNTGLIMTVARLVRCGCAGGERNYSCAGRSHHLLYRRNNGVQKYRPRNFRRRALSVCYPTLPRAGARGVFSSAFGLFFVVSAF